MKFVRRPVRIEYIENSVTKQHMWSRDYFYIYVFDSEDWPNYYGGVDSVENETNISIIKSDWALIKGRFRHKKVEAHPIFRGLLENTTYKGTITGLKLQVRGFGLEARYQCFVDIQCGGLGQTHNWNNLLK